MASFEGGNLEVFAMLVDLRSDLVEGVIIGGGRRGTTVF